jgi:cell division septal protein FtsQ
MAGARSTARRQLVGRLVRRRNRRRGSRAWLGLLSRVAPVAVAVVLAVVAWPLVRDAVQHHPYFTVREVIVRGSRHLAPDDVRRLAGVEPGVGIWAVDCARAERSLEGVPWVRTARVWRELPDKVLIRVREERPVAIIALSDAAPALHYVAPRGKVFARLEPSDARDYPYVTGLKVADLSGADAIGLRAIRRSLSLLRLAGRRGRVSEINVDRERGLTLLPVDPRIPVEVGWVDVPRRLARLNAVLEKLANRQDEIIRVSLRFDDEVIVRVRETEEPAAAEPKPRRKAA